MSHSRFAPSAAHRWLQCSASLNYAAADDDRSSPYAVEGTAAHELAFRSHVLGTAPDEYADVNGVPVTAEFAAAVGVFREHVDKLRGEGFDVFPEERVTHPDIPELFGTIDALCVSAEWLEVCDYKHGEGIVVEAVGNAQLLLYAVLALYRFPGRKVRLTIIQPRAFHPDGPRRSWEPTEADLRDIEARVAATVDDHAAGRTRYAAGDHCQFCPGRTACPELYQLTMKTAREVFDAAEPDTMTPQRAAQILETESAVNALFRSVKDWIHGRLERGEAVPGFKLVNKRAMRKWTADAAKIIRAARSRKLKKSDLVTETLISPAQLEKLTDRDFVSRFCESRSSGTTVVSDSDRRPAVSGRSATEAFEDV